MKATVSSSKNYAQRLDDPAGLDRPFFHSTAEEFRPKFKQNIEGAIKSGE
jgi:hypothetical protein